MSARILTREQLTELAALETTPGPLCVGGMGDSIRLEAPTDFSRPWTVASMPPQGWLAAGDPVLFAAATDLLATARDRELRIIDLERRLNMRESVLCDASADLHALTEEARALIADRDTTPDEMREFIGHLVDIYAGAAGRAVVAERDALRLERDRLQRELAVECFDAKAAPAGWRPDGRTWIGSGVYLVNLHGSGWTAYADTDGLRIPLRSTRLSGSWATALRAMEDPELPDVIARVSGG